MGCFKKPGAEKPATQVSVPIAPVYNGVADSYLVANGACQGNTAIVFTYSSDLTPEKTVDGSCSSDNVIANLPVNSGTSNQTFTINVVGRLQSKKSAPLKVTLQYSPTATGVSGSVIDSAGGVGTSASAVTFPAAGEAYLEQKQTFGSGISRSGLNGVIDP